MERIALTKERAARRQLDFAIEAYFRGEDIVCVHTLAAAAQGVLHDLANRIAPGKTWQAMTLQGSSISRKQYIDALHRAANFLKHGDRDPDATFDLTPEETETVIWIAIWDLQQLINRAGAVGDAFQVWLILRRWPDDPNWAPYVVAAKREGLSLEGLPYSHQLKLGMKMIHEERRHRASGLLSPSGLATPRRFGGD